MNYKEAKQWLESGKLTQAEVMRSPENKQHWFLMTRDQHKKCFMLVDDSEKVQTYTSLDDAAMVVKNIGFKTVVIHI
jgi:cupin superfamily acireductone dioxygenase involved in methionine salvage